MRDIDTAVADSLKALDPEWPIREADIAMVASVNRDGMIDPTATSRGVLVIHRKKPPLPKVIQVTHGQSATW